MNRYLSTLLILTLACGCNMHNDKHTATADPLSQDRDTTVRPGDNFFRYANGGWINKNVIPDEEAVWGIGNLVDEELYVRKRAINEKAIKDHPEQGSIARKIADFYTTGMDSASINKAGLAPLRPYLDSITNASDIGGILILNAALRQRGAASMFNLSIVQDQMNSEKMMVNLTQDGLGLPDRDYYFDTDKKTVDVREAYKRQMTRFFRKLGMDSATALENTAKVFTMETKLARASRKLADLRDPYKNYHKMSLTKFAAMTPNVNWPQYFSLLGITKPDTVVVGQPEFYVALNRELKATPLDVWRNYMKFNLINNFAPFLDDDTYNIYFEYRKVLYGFKSPRPRWKRVLDAEERLMGELLGQLFVKEYFNESAKKRYSDLVESIRDTYREHIQRLTWMSDSTKMKAIDKLSHIKKKVGYPDKWKDFSGMKIDQTSFAQNVMNANMWWFMYHVNKLGKPVDRDEWVMTPQTYNAYYRSGYNEIVLPAGIFTVPGKLDADVDDAFVYGYAGASTIGHEITHGFDDQGRQYDAQGNLRNWWTARDSAQFAARASIIISQFNEFMPVDTLHVNGSATQGENIADLGGLLLGLDAFKKTETYKQGKAINGLTPLQRYFLGYAYGWMVQERPEAIANGLKTDVHSPAQERVNGPMSNIPEFYEAFGIKKGDKMYRPDSLRVSIW